MLANCDDFRIQEYDNAWDKLKDKIPQQIPREFYPSTGGTPGEFAQLKTNELICSWRDVPLAFLRALKQQSRVVPFLSVPQYRGDDTPWMRKIDSAIVYIRDAYPGNSFVDFRAMLGLDYNSKHKNASTRSPIEDVRRMRKQSILRRPG